MPSSHFDLSPVHFVSSIDRTNLASKAARSVQQSRTGGMTCLRRQNVVCVTREPPFWKKRSIGCRSKRRGGYRVECLLATTLFVVLLTSSTAQEPIVYPAQPTLQSSYIAGLQLPTWRSEWGDVVAQLGGVHWCSEGVNARVDSEFLEDEMLSSCRQETDGYDMRDLLHPSEELMVPSEEQTMRLCRSEACAAWLNRAVKATWLPECKYRQSQTSVRSFAETLLRIRENLVDTYVEGGGDVAPNASSFREFYERNQLANLLDAYKEGVLNGISSPVLQIARQMTVQEDSSLMGSGDKLQSSVAVVEHPGSIRGKSISSPSSVTPSVSTSFSHSGSTSVGDEEFSSGSNLISSDSAGFTNTGSGPHASSTTTTSDLTPSYVYVVGAWVLFNGSYFLLMRRK